MKVKHTDSSYSQVLTEARRLNPGYREIIQLKEYYVSMQAVVGLSRSENNVKLARERLRLTHELIEIHEFRKN